MQTRSDQAQAYRFTTRRIVSALLSGEPETSERPMRRFGMSIFGSAMVATIVFAAVGVVGILFPSGAKLEDKTIVVEKEDGATFIYEKGQLFPVRNFTSARLAVGEPNPKISTVSKKALKAIPRGPLIGIPDLPDSLPDAKDLATGPWSVCSREENQGSSKYVTHLFVGGVRAGGTELGDQAVIVRRPNSDGSFQYHLVWHGHRLQIRDNDLASINRDDKPRVDVTSGLLNSIPLGPRVVAPIIDKSGEPGRELDGAPSVIGHVYKSSETEFYVLLESGLVPIGEVMRRLLVTATKAEPTPISIATYARANSPIKTIEPPNFPGAIPQVIDIPNPEMICAITTPVRTQTDTGIDVQVYSDMGDFTGLLAAPGAGTVGDDLVKLADYVQMPGGQAALVRAAPVPGDQTPLVTTYLVSQGYKYPLKSPEVQGFLGYGGVEPVSIPQFMLSLLRLGPTLDPLEASLSGPPAGPAATTTPPTPSTEPTATTGTSG
jgi:type VII secretion protein EccB